MKEWLLYTSTDMVNWTDGAVAPLKSFNWGTCDNGAWVEQVIERNGKFYMYCPIHGNGIGVLVSDSPYGTFKDPLNNDMISYSGDILKCDIKPKDYQEGPWFYKRKGKYYMAVASTCCPEGIGYSVSDSPVGPWHKTGTIMDHNPKSNGNPPGIIEYKEKSYIFGFNYDVHKAQSDVHCERRSTCRAELKYNADGTINELAFWDEQQVTPVTSLNPYPRVEAETIAWADGVTVRMERRNGK